MNNALKKINARVKVLQKKHPKSKRKTLQKQAGREWKAGKLKGAVGAVRKKAVKRKVVRKAKPRKRAVRRAVERAARPRKRALSAAKPKKQRVYKAKVVRVKPYKAKRYKRVSGMGAMSPLVPIVGIVAVGALAYYLISRAQQPALMQTNNPYRAQAQNSIVSWAATAGLGASAIASIIKALNNSDDQTVINQAQAPQQYFNPLGMGI